MKKRRKNKAPLIIVFILIIATFGTLYFFKDKFFSKNNEIETETKEEEKETIKTVSFTLAGNVLTNSEMWYDTASGDSYDFTYMFEYLNDIMTKSDINVYSEESIIGGTSLGRTVMSNYNTPKEILSTMKNIGFNVVTLGTSHAFDKNASGVTNAISYLDELEFTYAGIGSNKNIIEKNGVKIGFLSYTMSSKVSGADNYVSIYSEEKVKNDIESLNVDVIVVAIDWCGYETTEVASEQESVANYLSELGVNIIIGNNDIVIEPIRMVNNTLVCYSLGNLISGHSSIDSRISALVDFKLNLTEFNGEKTITFDDINVLFSYGYNMDASNYKVIPFSKITNELTNYSDYYDKYSQIIKGIDTINVYPIGD